MRRGTPALRKRQFISVVKNTINDCLKIFGYSKQPRIFETRFDSYAIMMFVEGQRHGESAIYYDYQKFQMLFRDCDDADRVYRLIHIVAHEMRHYYQFRQLTAKKPEENAKIIQEWKRDGIVCTNSKYNEYFGAVRELDAYTFAYMYMAERCEVILGDFGIPKNYRVQMKNYAKKLYGTAPPVFGKKYSKCFS